MTEAAFNKTLATSIRDARKKLGFSQDDIAHAIGLSRVSIVNIERGKSITTLYKFAAFCAILNIQLPSVGDAPRKKAIKNIKNRTKGTMAQKKKRLDNQIKALEVRKEKLNQLESITARIPKSATQRSKIKEQKLRNKNNILLCPNH